MLTFHVFSAIFYCMFHICNSLVLHLGYINVALYLQNRNEKVSIYVSNVYILYTYKNYSIYGSVMNIFGYVEAVEDEPVEAVQNEPVEAVEDEPVQAVDEPVEAVEHERIPEAEEENEIVEVEDGTVEKDDAAEDETPGPVIETTDSSSATEDGFNDEPDEAAFRIAKNLSEVCDLQLQNELLIAIDHQLQKGNNTLKAQLYHSSHYTTAIENAYTKATDNMSLASLVQSCYC